MAFAGGDRLCPWCYQLFPRNLELTHVCGPKPFPIYTNEQSAGHKTEPGETGSGGEWRYDTQCQRVFPGRMTPYRQHSKLLCEPWRTRSEDAFTGTSNMLQKGQKLYGGNLRRARDFRAVSPISVRKRPLKMFVPSGHQSGHEFRGIVLYLCAACVGYCDKIRERQHIPCNSAVNVEL